MFVGFPGRQEIALPRGRSAFAGKQRRFEPGVFPGHRRCRPGHVPGRHREVISVGEDKGGWKGDDPDLAFGQRLAGDAFCRRDAGLLPLTTNPPNASPSWGKAGKRHFQAGGQRDGHRSICRVRLQFETRAGSGNDSARRPGKSGINARDRCRGKGGKQPCVGERSEPGEFQIFKIQECNLNPLNPDRPALWNRSHGSGSVQMENPMLPRPAF